MLSSIEKAKSSNISEDCSSMKSSLEKKLRFEWNSQTISDEKKKRIPIENDEDKPDSNYGSGGIVEKWNESQDGIGLEMNPAYASTEKSPIGSNELPLCTNTVLIGLVNDDVTNSDGNDTDVSYPSIGYVSLDVSSNAETPQLTSELSCDEDENMNEKNGTERKSSKDSGVEEVITDLKNFHLKDRGPKQGKPVHDELNTFDQPRKYLRPVSTESNDVFSSCQQPYCDQLFSSPQINFFQLITGTQTLHGPNANFCYYSFDGQQTGGVAPEPRDIQQQFTPSIPFPPSQYENNNHLSGSTDWVGNVPCHSVPGSFTPVQYQAGSKYANANRTPDGTDILEGAMPGSHGTRWSDEDRLAVATEYVKEELEKLAGKTNSVSVQNNGLQLLNPHDLCYVQNIDMTALPPYISLPNCQEINEIDLLNGCYRESTKPVVSSKPSVGSDMSVGSMEIPVLSATSPNFYSLSPNSNHSAASRSPNKPSSPMSNNLSIDRFLNIPEAVAQSISFLPDISSGNIEAFLPHDVSGTLNEGIPNYQQIDVGLRPADISMAQGIGCSSGKDSNFRRNGSEANFGSVSPFRFGSEKDSCSKSINENPGSIQPPSVSSSVEWSDSFSNSPISIAEADVANCTEESDEERRSRMAEAVERVKAFSADDLISQNSEGDTLLHRAMIDGDWCLAEAILWRLIRETLANRVINVRNKLQQTPLCLAVIVNKPQLVEILVENGADVNNVHIKTTHEKLGPKFCNPLHLAASRGQLWKKTLRQLLNAKDIDLSAFDSDGKSAVHCAIESHGKQIEDVVLDCKETLRLLVERGAPLNQADVGHEKTPLHYAIERRDVSLVIRLLALASNYSSDRETNLVSQMLEAKTGNGNTALHLAASVEMNEQEHMKLIQQLMCRGADPSSKNTDGFLPRELTKNKKIVELLKGRPASARSPYSNRR